jgi:hypothetical protein
LRRLGDVLELDDGMLRVGDEAAVRSEAGVEVVACSGSGSRMVGGGGTTVSRAIEERENLALLKNC